MNTRQLLEDRELRCLISNPEEMNSRNFTEETRHAISVVAAGKRLGGGEEGANCVAGTFLLSNGSYLCAVLVDSCCKETFSHGFVAIARGGRRSVVEAEACAKAAAEGYDASVG